ncbi:MAG: hypothetical protein RR400_00100 [Clostridia bacterium]
MTTNNNNKLIIHVPENEEYDYLDDAIREFEIFSEKLKFVFNSLPDLKKKSELLKSLKNFSLVIQDGRIKFDRTVLSTMSNETFINTCIEEKKRYDKEKQNHEIQK